MSGPPFDVRLTRDAERDLRRLFDYVSAARSPGEAATLIRSMREKTNTLSRFPELGAVPKELETLGLKEHRQLVLPPYRIFYRIAGESILVTLIADGRRDMDALLRRRLLGG